MLNILRTMAYLFDSRALFQVLGVVASRRSSDLNERSSRASLALVTSSVVLALCMWCMPVAAQTEVVCADDIIPEGMAVTATGTAGSCAGACRAREVEPVCGPIMKICAGQPIPKGYVLDSVTTMPACRCLGSTDDGYVIRYTGNGDEAVSPYRSTDPQDASDLDNSGKQTRYAYENPPFGNLLCVNNWGPSLRYGNVPGDSPVGSQPTDSGPQLYDNPPPMGGGAGSYAPGSLTPGAAPNRPGASVGPPAPWLGSSSDWNDQQGEPFRVGQ